MRILLLGHISVGTLFGVDIFRWGTFWMGPFSGGKLFVQKLLGVRPSGE